MSQAPKIIDKVSTFTSALWVLGRGVRMRCPRCAAKGLMKGYLRPVTKCGTCGAKFEHIRADDAPPYFTLMIVGHIVIPAALLMYQTSEPPLWLMYALWLPIMLVMILLFLPFVKAATLALMWGLGISGREAGHS